MFQDLKEYLMKQRADSDALIKDGRLIELMIDIVDGLDFLHQRNIALW